MSVVIPTLNEAERIGGCVRSCSVAGEVEQKGPGSESVEVEVEVVVVDGGSSDGTQAAAERACVRLVEEGFGRGVVGCRVVEGKTRGRGFQLRQGVEETEGEAVVLLHGDSELPPGWAGSVVRALGRGEWGAFRVAFTGGDGGPGVGTEVVAWAANAVRVGLVGVPYGDQGMFMRRAALDSVGGVPRQPFLEDLELSLRLRKVAGRPVLADAGPVRTSGRRFAALGALRTAALNQATVLAYLAGVDATTLGEWYRRQMPRPPISASPPAGRPE